MSRAYASVSIIAMLGLMAGCSQPASYATVDLGGSYAGNPPQPYNTQSGLPVYQSTQVYTTPYDTGYAQQPQLVYRDAPQNQVVSLAPVYGNGYGQPVQQSYPSFGAVAQGPVLTDETILRSDGFIDMGAYGGTRTATLAPGAGSIGYDRMSVMSDVPQYSPAPQQSFAQPAPMAEPVPFAEPIPFEEPEIVQGAPEIPRIAMIETGELPALGPVPVAPMASEQPAMVAGEYAPFAAESYSPVAQMVVPENAPVAPLIEVTPLDLMQTPSETFAGLSALPSRDDPQSVADYYDLGADQAGGEIREAGLATALSTPQAAARVASASDGRGIVLPPASTAYPRPYDGLPPGYFPPYEFPSADSMISQADPVGETPEFAAYEPVPAPAPAENYTMPVAFDAAGAMSQPEQASTRVFGGLDHTIRSGDTLYSIARLYSVTPQAIAGANGLDLSGTIFPGSVIQIPSEEMSRGPETLGDAPIVVLQTAEAASTSTYTTDLTNQPASMVDISELARMFRARENGQAGAEMPIISAEAGAAMRGRPDLRPTEYISEPQGSLGASTTGFVAPAPTPAAVSRGSYAWPVHGEVYRLSQGAIEIDAPMGQTVVAPAAGRVVDIQNGSRGYLVVIEHDDGWRSLTLGVSDVTVQPGQRVFEGASLGRTGAERIRFELRDGASNVAETLGILRS